MPKNPNPQLETEFSEDELTLRRDEVIRRMANTPPQPKAKTLARPKKKKKAVSGRAVRKAPVRREA